MEEFDTSDLAWILYKLFYGIDNDKTIVKNKERSYMEIVFGNKSINMSGDTDYNFGPGWAYSIRKKYEGYLGEVLSEYEKLYNIQLQRCVKLYKSVLNISLMPQTGNLQITKKGIGNDRVDTFIWALDSYYNDETSLLFNNSSFNNTSYLKEYLEEDRDVILQREYVADLISYLEEVKGGTNGRNFEGDSKTKK